MAEADQIQRGALARMLMARPELAGPPAPPDWHAPRQLQGREPEAKRDLLKELAPLLAAQALDLLSTEKPLGFLAGSPRSFVAANGTRFDFPSAGEGNPVGLPGMAAPGFQGTATRVGWGLGEALLAAALLKHYPQAGRGYVGASTQYHSSLARGNWRNRELVPQFIDNWRRNVGGTYVDPEEK